MAQILSPLPGTFYRSPSPGQPAYKNDGDSVAVGDVIGLKPKRYKIFAARN